MAQEQFKTGLCDCCASGFPTCLYGTFCGPCAAGDVCRSADGNWMLGCLGTCCLGCIGTTIVRNSYRTKNNIEGGCFMDCILSTFCGGCVLCQLMSDHEARSKTGTVVNINSAPQSAPGGAVVTITQN